MQENQETQQSMTVDQYTIEVLGARVADLEKERARLMFALQVKEQEAAQLRGEGSGAEAQA